MQAVELGLTELASSSARELRAGGEIFLNQVRQRGIHAGLIRQLRSSVALTRASAKEMCRFCVDRCPCTLPCAAQAAVLCAMPCTLPRGR